MTPSRKTICIAVSALLAAILALSCACAFALGGVAAWAQGDDGQKEAAPGFYKGAALPEPEAQGELLEARGGSGFGMLSTGSASSTAAECEDIIKQRVNRALSLVGAGQGVTTDSGVEYAVVDFEDLGITDYAAGAKLAYSSASSFPDFFYLGNSYRYGYTYSSAAGGYILSSVNFRLAYTASAIPSMVAKYNAAMDDLMSWVPPNATTANKVKAVHDWLVRNCLYNMDAANKGLSIYGPDPWNAYGAVVNKSPVCEGYSEAFQAAMQRLGLECTRVEQWIGSSGHEWNRLKVDGKWYNIDVTHDDPLYSTYTDGGFDETPRTNYFMKSDAWFKANPSGGEWHTEWSPEGEAGTDTTYDSYTWTSAVSSASTSSANITALSVAPSSAALGFAEATTLSASASPAYGSYYAHWTSSNPTIASVDPQGYVVAGSTAGVTTLTCTAGGKSSTARVEVKGGKVSDSAVSVTLSPSSFTYTGSACTPVATVTHTTSTGTITLVEGEDYSVSYTSNVNAGTATATITGRGGYTGTKTVNFTINQADISKKKLVLDPAGATYAPGMAAPSASIEGLVPGTDYDLSWIDASGNALSAPTAAGAYTAVATGKGNWTGSVQAGYTVAKASLADATIDTIAAQTYDGTEKKPEPAVTLGGTTLQKDTDYTLSYADNKNAGTATVTVTGTGNYEGAKTANFTINQADISKKKLVLDPASVTYTPGMAAPSASIEGLSTGTDYDLSWIDASGNAVSAPTAAGTYTAVATGKGNWTGNVQASYTVAKADLNPGDIADIPDETYDGRQKKPEPVVTYNGVTLTKGIDYTLSYEKNVNAAKSDASSDIPTVYVTGKGNYDGLVPLKFTINPADMSEKTLVLDPAGATYAPNLAAPSASIEGLVPGTDYDLSWIDASGNALSAPTAAGAYTAVATGKGNWTGSAQAGYMVAKADLGIATIDPIESVTYDGTQREPAPVVRLGGTTLEKGTDYTVSYTDNKNVGTATVTVTGTGNYEGTKTASFTINRLQISKVQMTYTTRYVYTGQPICPDPVLEFNGETLEKGVDYIIEYKDNVEVGSAQFVVKGKDESFDGTNFEGTNTIGFQIVEKPVDIASVVEVSKIADQDYTGKAICPEPAVTVNGETLVEGTDYTLSYKNNVNPGTATVTITGKGSYTGTKEVTFTIKGVGADAWKRLAGGTAIGTMKAIVNEGWGSSDWAIVATTNGYHDALSASGLAGLLDCPILMTAPDKLTDATSKLITAKKVKNVIVVGGVSAVSDNVFNQIKKLGVSVERVAGGTAIGTANAIYAYGNALLKAGKIKEGWGEDAVVATSSTYQDALSIAPYAYADKAPIFLAKGKPGTLTDATAKAIKNGGFSRTVIAGSDKAVAKSVESQVTKKVERLAGGTAYGTSRKIADFCIREGMSAAHMGVATGKSYYDALAGAALCGKNKSVLILADDGNSNNVDNVVKPHKAELQKSCYIFGGTPAVSVPVENKIKTASK